MRPKYYVVCINQVEDEYLGEVVKLFGPQAQVVYTLEEAVSCVIKLPEDNGFASTTIDGIEIVTVN